MRTGTIAALAAAGALFTACWKADDAWHLTSRGINGAPIFRERNDERIDEGGGTTKAAPEQRNARTAPGAPHRASGGEQGGGVEGGKRR